MWYKVFVTWSNAKLLSSELATHLTGRFVKIELYPFSFAEYCAYVWVDLASRTTSNTASILNALDIYIQDWWFPDYLIYKQKEFLQRIYEDVLYKDIIARFGIRQVDVFKKLVNYLYTNMAVPTSYTNIKELLGIKTTKTVTDFVQYVIESYMLFDIYKYDPSLKKQYTTDKKIYVIDNWLRNAVAFCVLDDLGKLFENMVYIELKRQWKNIFFAKNGFECDFLCVERNTITHAIQVCYELHDTNKPREYKWCIEAMKKYTLATSYIITYNQEETITVSEGIILCIPFWKWIGI